MQVFNKLLMRGLAILRHPQLGERNLHCFVFLKALGLIFAFICLSMGLTACHKAATPAAVQQAQKPVHSSPVEAKDTVLYFRGTIKPHTLAVLSSPTEGYIDHRHFDYGQHIAIGQPLLTLHSEKLQTQFRHSLSDYLRAKNNYKRHLASFKGTEVLYKANIVGREHYLNEQSELASDQLAYLNAKDELVLLLNHTPSFKFNLDTLSLKSVNQIKMLLSHPMVRLTLKSTQSGIALVPDRSQRSASETQPHSLEVGSHLNKGDNWIAIAAPDQVDVTINVSEYTIEQLSMGQSAHIQTPVLPGIVLTGQITHMGTYAERDSSDSTAYFRVQLSIKNLSQKQRYALRSGVSAKVAIMTGDSKRASHPA